MKTVLSIILFFIVFNCVSQETELDRRNGFKDIKLATPVDSIKGVIFKEDLKYNELPVKVYKVEHSDYSSIGEVKINSIELKAYKGLIYYINVLTEKDTRLMKGMESALGKPVYNIRDESYNWSGQKVNLKFRSNGRTQLSLEYSSNVIFKMMAEDKKQKIKDISSDF